jgi:hypothetical protein
MITSVTNKATNPIAKFGAGDKHVSKEMDPTPGVILPNGQGVHTSTDPVE